MFAATAPTVGIQREDTAMNRQPLRILALLVFGVASATGAVLLAPSGEVQGDVRGLHERARERFARIGSYVARLTRHEVVRGERWPEEVILLKFRSQPWSVYMKWVGDAGQGREGVYVKGRYGDKVHTRLAAGDIPLVPAGRRMALDPNGSLLRAASPHPVTDLGIGAAIDRIGAVLAAQEAGNPRLGTLRTIAPQRHEGFAEPAPALEHRLPPGLDPVLPGGGRRVYWFDPATGLPLVMQTRDASGVEVEYYHYDRLQLSVGLDDADFDPDLLWGVPVRDKPAASSGDADHK
jgi:hypothetical protein